MGGSVSVTVGISPKEGSYLTRLAPGHRAVVVNTPLYGHSVAYFGVGSSSFHGATNAAAALNEGQMITLHWEQTSNKGWAVAIISSEPEFNEWGEIAP